MSSHIDVDGDCPLAVVPCKYCDIGCKLKVLRLSFLEFFQRIPCHYAGGGTKFFKNIFAVTI